MDSRDDKRYTEKKNKSERARRKKEDTARLRQLVDLALSLDPRIKRIKQEEKEAREAKKKGKTGAANGLSAKQKAEEEKKKAEEEAKKKEEEEKVCFRCFLVEVSILLANVLRRLLVRRRRRRRPLLLTLRRRRGEPLVKLKVLLHSGSRCPSHPLALPFCIVCSICHAIHAFLYPSHCCWLCAIDLFSTTSILMMNMISRRP